MSTLRSQKHSSKNFQIDFDRYGEEAFVMEVLDIKKYVNGRSNEFEYMEKLKTYDEKYGYNDYDGAMRVIRRKNGLKDKRLIEGKGMRIKFPSNFNFSILTKKQKDVCEEYLLGKTTSQIAEERGVSQQNICSMIHNAIKKNIKFLKVEGRT